VSPRRRRKGTIVFVLMGTLYAGVTIGWLLHAAFSPQRPTSGQTPPAIVPAPPVAGTTGVERPPAREPEVNVPVVGSDPIAALKRRGLRLPIDGADVAAMKGDFRERRGGGSRGHEAVDILAPRHTPIHAVDDGSIARLFESAAGGTTIYQFDPSGRFCYYYAHLQAYAPGLRDGQRIERGDVIGYVGTTGNAPPNTPHLHFAIFELTDAKQWWNGTPIDPFLVYDGR
jgi:murein DD-endopeptidase MepM/ murein hydrolase activator NlpD